MKKRLPMIAMIARGLLGFLVLVGVSAGMVVLFKMVTTLVTPALLVPVAMVFFGAYIYVVGRWVFRQRTRPLSSAHSKRLLRHLLGTKGPTRKSTPALRDKAARRW